MKKKHTFLRLVIHLFACVLMILPFKAEAQDTTPNIASSKPIVQYVGGKKHIYLDRLGVSPNMTVMELLELFPELTTRGSSDVLNNYAIVIDKYSLGDIRDEALFQMTISELKEIVISDNPSAAYANNGVGGVIELVRAELRDGFSGNVQMDVSTEKCVLLSSSFNYQKNKFRIRSFVKGEFYKYLAHTTNASYQNETLLLSDDSYETTTAGMELAKFGFEYDISAKDALSFSIWETYGQKVVDGFHVGHGLLVGYNYDTTRQRGLSTLSRLQYSHNFNQWHSLDILATYNFATTRVQYNWEPYTYNRPDKVAATIQYNGALVHSEQHQLQMSVGLDYSFSDLYMNKPAIAINSLSDISPVLEFTYKYSDKLFARAGGRYHYDLYTNHQTGKKSIDHDYMVTGEVDYTPAIGHTLRVSGLRDRLSITEGHSTGEVIAGDISYIFQQNFKEHYLNISAGFQYNRANLVTGDFYNIFAANLGIVWQYRWFCLALANHIFDNATCRADESRDYHLYYNIRLTPLFTLPKGWSLSASLMYNSPLISTKAREGDYFYCALRASKKIGRWAIHAEFADPFHYRTENQYMEETFIQYTTLHLYQRYLNLGVSFTF